MAGRGTFSCKFQRAVLAALPGAKSLQKWQLYMLVCCIKRCLFVYLCQIMVGRRYEKQISDDKEVDIAIC